jgi:hypothetical protein
MSIKGKLLAVAAVTALTAATAVPAMALENEFHGSFAARGYNSNYLSGTAGRINVVGDSALTNNWVEQRARIFYTAKANDSLKLVTAFELDNYWGKSSYTNGRNSGGALGQDSTQIETKWVYLDFTDPFAGINFKVGAQGLNDDYKNLLFGIGADASGIQATKSFGPLATRLGWFRLDDRNSPVTATSADSFTNGRSTRDLLLLAGKYNVTKDLTVGGSYYFLNDDNAPSTGTPPGVPTGTANDYNVHILGVNAAAKMGDIALDGFGIYEFGTVGTAHVNAFAGNAGAKIKAGPGNVNLNFLYVSGNSGTAGTSAAFGGNSFVSINNTTSGAFSENGQGSIGNMWLLVRNPKETTNEQSIIAESSNLNQGIIGGTVGYDYAAGKVFANANVGIAATAKRNSARNGTIMGTEVNGEVGYKVFDNMKALVRAAYVVLGDYYNNSSTNPASLGTDPANPYEAQLVLAYTF